MNKKLEILAVTIQQRKAEEFSRGQHETANRELDLLGAKVNEYAGLHINDKIELIRLLKYK